MTKEKHAAKVERWLEVLRAAVKKLAGAPEMQIGLKPTNVCCAHELALDFMRLWDITACNPIEIGIPDKALFQALQPIADYIDQSPSTAWSDESLRSGERWKGLRELATNALALFPPGAAGLHP